jgi:hypothetical protein
VFSYLMKMTRAHTLIVLVGLTAMFAVPARAQSDIMSDNYNIMVPEKGYKPSQPEPWLAPKYKSPRGTVKRDHPEDDDRVARRTHRSPGSVRTPDGAELANGVRVGTRWRRNVSGSCHALLSSGRRFRPNGRRPRQLHGRVP